LGNGDGTFQAQHIFATAAGPNGIMLADLNGDGRPDVVVAAYSSSVAVLLNSCR
jgi:hypothetical protein